MLVASRVSSSGLSDLDVGTNYVENWRRVALFEMDVTSDIRVSCFVLDVFLKLGIT